MDMFDKNKEFSVKATINCILKPDGENNLILTPADNAVMTFSITTEGLAVVEKNIADTTAALQVAVTSAIKGGGSVSSINNKTRSKRSRLRQKRV